MGVGGIVMNKLNEMLDSVNIAHRERSAEGYIEKIRKLFLDFQSKLTDHETLAICLANFGQNITVAVENIYPLNDGLIVFEGLKIDDGQSVKLIQHINQTSVLLTKVSTVDEPKIEKKQIGFDVPE